MNSLTKVFCSLLFLMLLSHNTRAQNLLNIPSIEIEFAKIKPNEVRELLNNDLLIISYKVINFDDNVNDIHKENIVLKIENKTTSSLRLTFAKNGYYNDKCVNCNGGEGSTVDVLFEGGQSFEGTLSGRNDTYGLTIFSKMLTLPNVPKLTKLMLSDISIITLN